MKTKTKTKTKTKKKGAREGYGFLRKNKTKKYNKNKKRTSSEGGGFLDSIGNSIIHVPKKKNYTVGTPGSGLIKTLSSLTNSGEKSQLQKQQQLLSIIFNYRLSNQIDITKIKPSTVISSNSITREPYVLLNSMGKYLLVMYREVNKKNIAKPVLLLHFLIGLKNRSLVKLFPYNEPNVKSGKIQSFVIKLYKYVDTDNTDNFIKINNFNKKKAYEEFAIYITPNVINKKLSVINTFRFMVKGEIGSGVNLFNILSKQKAKIKM